MPIKSHPVLQDPCVSYGNIRSFTGEIWNEKEANGSFCVSPWKRDKCLFVSKCHFLAYPIVPPLDMDYGIPQKFLRRYWISRGPLMIFGSRSVRSRGTEKWKTQKKSVAQISPVNWVWQPGTKLSDNLTVTISIARRSHEQMEAALSLNVECGTACSSQALFLIWHCRQQWPYCNEASRKCRLNGQKLSECSEYNDSSDELTHLAIYIWTWLLTPKHLETLQWMKSN